MKESNIDFLKWKCEKAEGFKVKGNFVSVLSSVALWSFEELANDEILFSFLLQRVIEYYKMTCEILYIEIKHKYDPIKKKWSCLVFHRGLIQMILENDSIDIAKEAALKYIFEQEKNNEGK